MGLDDFFERYKDLPPSEGYDAVTDKAENAPRVNDPFTTDNREFAIWHVLMALRHYIKSSGKPWIMNFERIKWQSDLDSILKKAVTKQIKEGKLRTGRIRILNIEAATRGPDAFIIGRHTVCLSGILIINPDGKWFLRGELSSYMGYDRYNFNSGDRTRYAEAATTFGRNLGQRYGSRPFDINVPGKLQIILYGP